MDIVIDANELFSCIIAKGKRLNSRTLDIFFSDNVKLFAPMKLLKELDKNVEDIVQKSGFSVYEGTSFIDLLKIRIKFVPFEEFIEEIGDAKRLAPHIKDAQYFALALHLDAIIWSQEKSFKNQKKIRIMETNELWRFLFD